MDILQARMASLAVAPTVKRNTAMFVKETIIHVAY